MKKVKRNLPFLYLSYTFILLFLFSLISFIIFVLNIHTLNAYDFQDTVVPKKINKENIKQYSLQYENKIFSIDEIDSYNQKYLEKNPDYLKQKEEQIQITIPLSTNEIDEEKEKKQKEKDKEDNEKIKNFKYAPPSARKRFKKLSKPKKEKEEPTEWKIPKKCNGRIDVVWLWVNGSDIHWLKEYQQYNANITMSQYREYNTLLYSMRSVYHYAPYIKNWYLITYDQIPQFIKAPYGEKSFKLTYKDYSFEILSHRQLFEPNEIPTFNSDAIESVIHRIPSLSECFLYLNDDMLLDRYSPPSIWINSKNKVILYKNKGMFVPNKKRADKKKIKWDRSLDYTNHLMNKLYHLRNSTKHPYLSHNCYFMQKSHLQILENTFEKQYSLVRTYKTRNERSLNIPYLYFLYNILEHKIKPENERDWLYFQKFSSRRYKNMMVFKNIDYVEPYCICLNDDFDILQF